MLIMGAVSYWEILRHIAIIHRFSRVVDKASVVVTSPGSVCGACVCNYVSLSVCLLVRL